MRSLFLFTAICSRLFNTKESLYFVYILYSKKLSRFYVGFTSDLFRRLNQHNKAKSSYTSNGISWDLLWYAEKQTKHDARSLEKKLKHLSRKRKIKFLLKYESGVYNKILLKYLKCN